MYSPDQLMNSNTAIYSANFQESKTVENWSPLHDSRSNIIWEGHGLLSNILSSDHSNSQSQVTGKITSDSQLTPNHYDCSIEVLIQLHPVSIYNFFFSVIILTYIIDTPFSFTKSPRPCSSTTISSAYAIHLERVHEL